MTVQPERSSPTSLGRRTQAIHGGLVRSHFDETAEALYLTSGYVYDSPEQAAAAFSGDLDHYTYSRAGNPTVAMFEERLRLLDGSAEACHATASGMAAVFVALGSLCGAGDRVVASRSLFGSCFGVVNSVLPRWGVETVLVNGTDLQEWRDALSCPTAAVFFESPSNPMQELVDVAGVSELAHDVGAKVVVDNAFATPIFSTPLALGADVVTYSATKHIDGQGRALGGAILGSAEFIDGPVHSMIRTIGPSLSPFNAWVLLKGLETLELRVTAAATSALELARRLECHPVVDSVRYPLLESHPQYELARRQMSGGGTIVTFTVPGGTAAAHRVMDALGLFSISNNFGDAKSLVTHPATTTHMRIGPDARAAAGITDGTIRLSVGLEDPEDLWRDVDRALDAAS